VSLVVYASTSQRPNCKIFILSIKYSYILSKVVEECRSVNGLSRKKVLFFRKCVTITRKDSSNGLLYDRKYCIVNTMTNSLLSIRHYPRLASLKVFIFLSTTGASTSFVAQLVFEVSDSVQIPNVPKVCAVYESDLRQTYIHCWLSCVLQVPCQLMTVEDFESLSTSGKSKEMKERYRNDAHLLVVGT